MTWLVTGGAGYIGSHVVKAFTAAGVDCLIVDSLASGHRSFVPPGVPLVVASILDTGTVARAMAEHHVTGVVHLAGFKYAGVSVREPLLTFEQNVEGTVSLLRAMETADVERLVFSSSAAVYGTPNAERVTEETATGPESPYGESKLAGEWLVRDQGIATGLKHTSLRYFNVVGSGSPELYDSSPHNLFPLLFRALAAGQTPKIFGNDYSTPDGTCVRDYVHVTDLATSHVAAARALDSGVPLERVYNLGSGEGVSVHQIMNTARQVTEIDFEPEIAPRRPGDPDRIVAAGDLAARDLDWRMRHTLEDMVSSAYHAQRLAAHT
ncbi:UDP-glucose 4-epimerase GalE [Arthrobacter sp. SO3]|uniref:UDP-glucose 4-epimerase GalE n=1 Tax=Arthrobacter sp. SO3 TaxID=1897057 RepID=UPI001CFFF215|nr:UDP-glucose 4-epimerase GalE [Arthrobacter sp. SO3]MCB5290767.1 UDP-glucose 4-epimerase [Arthrobacter sp. SO3]